MALFKHRVFIFFFFYMPLSVFAQKTDKLHLDNGDWITGEITKMLNGELTFKTDAAATIQVKWDRIFQMVSDKNFEVWLTGGVVYYGSLDVTENDEKYKILLRMEDTDITLNMNEIMELAPIKNKFWARLHGAVDMGFSYTKASDIMVLNGSLNVSYRPRRSITALNANSNFTGQKDGKVTKKQDVGIGYAHFIQNLWAPSVFMDFQQNTELGIELRSSLGGGISKVLVSTNLMRFYPTAGVAVNREKATETKNTTSNIEGVFRLDYKIFKFRKPEVHLNSYFAFYPSFTVKERYRTDFNMQVHFKFIKNFYLKISFYHNFDTKPPNETSSKSDWGLNTSVGVTFN